MSLAVDPVIRALNAEWLSLAVSPVPTDWSLPGDTLGELLRGIADDPDTRLSQLLRRHAAGDRLAGRVVLQAMLGKLVLMAAQDVRHGAGDYVAECWLRLADYPLARRPRRIAANLALDTRLRVRAGDDRRPVADVVLDEVGVVPRLDVPRLVRAATRLGLIDRHAGACLYAVYGLGLRSHEAAVRLRISAASVRARNAHSIRRLATHATALAAAA